MPPLRPHPHPAGDHSLTAPAAVAGRSPLDTLEISFRLLCTGPQPLAVDGRRFGYGLPRRTIPLVELAAVLHHPSVSYDARHAAWRHLVDRARTGGPAWVVGAAGVALPGLRRAAGRLARAASRADVEADLLAGFLAALRTVDVTRPGICGRLCNAGYVAARAAVRADEAATAGRPNHRPGSVLPPAPYGHPDLVLARAVAAGVITAADAHLVGATRLEDVTVADYADRAGVSRWVIYRRRSLAETRLVAAIRDGRLSDPDGDTIRAATSTVAPEVDRPPRH